MNAVVVSSYDAAPRFDSFAEPVAGEGELLVTMTAAGLHPIVKALRMGRTMGALGCFRCAGGGWRGAAGGWAAGFLWAVRSPFGTFAERTLASAAMCLELPDGLEDVVAAGLANPAMSSWRR